MKLFRNPELTVLMVCSANICRSPMAESMLRTALASRGLQNMMRVSSAGTHASQPGRKPDPRARLICEQRGIKFARIRARQVRQDDFERYTHLLAMDTKNLDWLLNHCSEVQRSRISLIGSWADERHPLEIPDPYYGNLSGFVEVFDRLRVAIEGFISGALSRSIVAG